MRSIEGTLLQARLLSGQKLPVLQKQKELEDGGSQAGGREHFKIPDKEMKTAPPENGNDRRAAEQKMFIMILARIGNKHKKMEVYRYDGRTQGHDHGRAGQV